ncbi:MAG: ATP-binding cassette domain-containing protein [Candidatus Omnitrophica bacterium]|jgi:ATP-binding cassette subfamily F protein uup|nr:ATP-binding cassette domain-containing protein [Candidatus Omnitrophota bacterium]
MALISLEDISLAFGGPPLFDKLNLQVELGERIALLGRNGVGKTTLMKVMAGDVPVNEGRVLFQKGARVTHLPQEVPDGITGSVLDIVLEAAGGDDHDNWEIHHQADRIINELRLDPDSRFEQLSGGQKRKVLLAKALVLKPEALLLDEPTNHLDIGSIDWLEAHLKDYKGAIFFVTHDRMFMTRMANRIIELDRGRIFSWTCSYPTFLERKQMALDAEASEQAEFDKKLAREEVWIRQGIKARRTRNEGRVRALEKLRSEKKAQRQAIGSVRMTAQDADRSGQLVCKAERLSHAYDGKPLMKDFSTQITRGDKIGLIGPNGAGKTTLIKILLGQLVPNEGTVRLGTNLEIIYFDQLRGQLDENKTVVENINPGGGDSITLNGRPRNVMGYLQDFLFSPDRARSPVKVLSGGERNRLLLARLFTKPSNFLIMDEPTNDLDVETLELLEELLIDYAGTLILVSHDRAFINNVVTSTITFEGNGRLGEYPGGYDDWLRQRPAPIEETAKGAQNTAKQKTQASKDASPAASSAKKMSFKEQRELESLPSDIEKLEAEQSNLVAKVADPLTYKKDPKSIASAAVRIDEIKVRLAELYRRWEHLETLKKQ